MLNFLNIRYILLNRYCAYCLPCVTDSTYPSMYNFGLEVSPLKCNLEGRPPLFNTNSEAGALPSELRIKNNSD